MENNIGLALLLTTLAGLSTGIGSLLGIAIKPGPRFMSFSLGFAAGIMILISFVELLPEALETIGFVNAHIAFFLGMLVAMALDFTVPHIYMAEDDRKSGTDASIKRTGILLALGIGIHNFPEGMATFAGTLKDVDLGIAMAVAIAVHNIPEGLAVAAPIYAATGSRKQAFMFSMFSGIAEPLGALFAAVIIHRFLTPELLAWILGAIAGIMIFISIDELAPASKKYGHEHLSISSVMLGMIVMAASLYLLK